MFKKIWNADFSNYNLPNLSILWIVVAFYIAFVEFDTGLLLGMNDMFEHLLETYPQFAPYAFALTAITFLYGLYLVFFVVYHERLSYRKIGKQKVNAIALPHFLVNVIDLAATIGVVLLLNQILSYVFGFKLNLESLMTVDGEFHPFQAIIDFYDAHIPTYIELPYLIAIFVTLICTDLPIYIFHYLTHKSRLLWYVMHRSHHSPEYLSPFGSGPVFAFSLLIAVPYFFVILAVSKLIYPDPMIVEMLVIQFLFLATEKFNHSSAYYDFASKHRWFFSFFGNGPYHYTHHSAREGEEIVNIANICFNFWDRVFGTFKAPEKNKPPVGLTHQPIIVLNPLRLYLSGVATILYELKHNPLKHWLKIIFGDVYYTPPKTKEYLIVSYPGEKLYPL